MPSSFPSALRSAPRSPADDAIEVTMHDGSVVRFRSVPEGYRPHERKSKSTFATAIDGARS
jgi:hypothetical protein